MNIKNIKSIATLAVNMISVCVFIGFFFGLKFEWCVLYFLFRISVCAQGMLDYPSTLSMSENKIGGEWWRP